MRNDLFLKYRMTKSVVWTSSWILMTSFLVMNLQSQAESLKEYLWTNRVIITFSTSAANKERQLLIKQIATDHCEYKHRDLVHLDLIKGSDEYERLIHKFSITDHAEFKMLLIGKDGKLKLNTNSSDLKSVFSVIDTMPMRKKEMHIGKC